MSRADRLARRGHRRRGPAVVFNTRATGLPKMADTIREFAMPLLARLPGDAATTEWSLELHLAALVWNDVVDGMERDEIIEDVARAAPGRETDPVLEELIVRKRELYSRDVRRIIALDTYREHDRIQIVAASERPGISD